MKLFRAAHSSIFGAAALLSSAIVVSAQDMTFEASGQFTPTCSTGFSGRPATEGMSFHFETTLSLDLLLGEPVVRASLAWRPVGFGATCFQPYGQDELVRLGSVDQYDPEGLAHPIDVDLVAELIVPSTPNGRVFLPFNPGALSRNAGEVGYNTAGSPNWDALFFTLPGLGSDFWDTDNYAFLSAEAAKDIFTAGFDLAQVHVAQADFDLTELKSNYGAQVDTASALVKVANRLEQWGRETFDSYPDGVAARIAADTQLDAPEQIVALRNTIDDIQDLHDQLQQQSGDADSKATIDQQKTDLAPFLDAIDTPADNTEFWHLLANSSAKSAQAERDGIAARVAEAQSNALIAAEKERGHSAQMPPHQEAFELKKVVRSLKSSLGDIVRGHYDTDCGKAGFRMLDIDGNVKTGVMTLNIGQHLPKCGSGPNINRNSVFEFSVLDIVSYELSAETLVINFSGQSLSEDYYTSASYPARFQEESAQLSLLINPEEESGLARTEAALTSTISRQ